MSELVVQCKVCGKKPEDIEEYVYGAQMCLDYNMSPTIFVQENEGTYNKSTGKFYCTDCYIKVGMPLGTA